MKITIIAIGSRGDVQPYVALGIGLQKAGYEVSVAAYSMFENFIKSWGLGFFAIQGDPKEIFRNEALRLSMELGYSRIRSWLTFSKIIKPLLLSVGTDSMAACRSSDAVIYSPLGFYLAPHIAEKLNIPCIPAFYLPMQPTGAFPSHLFPIQRNLGRFFNRFTHLLTQALYWLPLRSEVNRFRVERLDMPPITSNMDFRKKLLKQQRLMLFCFSPHIMPKPSDWVDHAHITGYWFLPPSQWNPPADLVNFINAGKPPVFAGFSSNSSRNPEEITNIVLQAIERTKQRGILLTDWGGLMKADLPDNVFLAESVPHDWLFPRMSAVIHHAGAGTIGAALKAGIPSVTVLFNFPVTSFLGDKIAELGVATKPIPVRKLSVEGLSEAIERAVNDKDMKARAAQIGERIRNEDGVGRAVELIHNYLSSGG